MHREAGMNLLVIGGSYFYGRVFLMVASKHHEITVVNRGTYSLEQFGVIHRVGERHDPQVWAGCRGQYDAVIDFCAYQPGDIACVLENLGGSTGQYILISTVDVYRRGIGGSKGEDTAFENRRFPGEAGEYIAGKVALEQELARECARKGTGGTVLRPGILYGPYNYAPRESEFIRIALQYHVIPRYTDADGRFQFVYVKDAAHAILACLADGKTYGRAYNLVQDEILDYEGFFQALAEAAGPGADRLPMTLEQAARGGYPIPFPATGAETELVSNTRSKTELGMTYTPFQEGMGKTWKAFSHVYREDHGEVKN